MRLDLVEHLRSVFDFEFAGRQFAQNFLFFHGLDPLLRIARSLIGNVSWTAAERQTGEFKYVGWVSEPTPNHFPFEPATSVLRVGSETVRGPTYVPGVIKPGGEEQFGLRNARYSR